MEHRKNRFFDDNLTKKRSSSLQLSAQQKKTYDFIAEKTIKRERQSLSHFRYNKMKKLILKEVRHAIQEAEIEASVSLVNQSIIQ